MMENRCACDDIVGCAKANGSLEYGIAVAKQ